MDFEELTSADDTLHRPDDDHQWWTETVWFPFFSAAAGLFGNYYLWFRPNLGIAGGGLRLFDRTAILPWEVPFNLYHRALRLPRDLDLRDARLGDEIWLRAIDPAHTYAFGIDHARCTADLRWEALGAPLVRRPSPEPPFRGGHHVDQVGRVTGTVVLDGTTIEIDCIAPRDRSWGPRSDRRGVKASYDWAFASGNDGFLTLSLDPGGDDRDDRIVQGLFLRDGHLAKLVSGRRIVRRNADLLPSTVEVSFEDASGRTARASGVVTATSTELVQRPMLLHQSLTRWSWDGHEAFGEDEDVWDPDLWRAHRASRASSVSTVTD